MSFSQRLRQLRKEKGLAQEDVALAVKLSIPAISMYENGNRTPDSMNILESLADFFNVSVDYLMGRSNNRNILQVNTVNENLIKIRGNRSIQEFADFLNVDSELLERYEKGLEDPLPSFLEHVYEMENLDINGNLGLEEQMLEHSVQKQKTCKSLDFLDVEVRNWVENPESKEFLEFFYSKAIKSGLLSKQQLSKVQIVLRLD